MRVHVNTELSWDEFEHSTWNLSEYFDEISTYVQENEEDLQYKVILQDTAGAEIPPLGEGSEGKSGK